MTTRRVYFDAWGYNDHVTIPGYALMTAEDPTPAAAAARAIATKSKLEVVAFKPDGETRENGKTTQLHYEMTLGSPVPRREGGGWIPRSRCWISLDARS